MLAKPDKTNGLFTLLSPPLPLCPIKETGIQTNEMALGDPSS